MFKDTSLVVIIGIFDLTLAAKAALSDAAWRGFGVEAYVFIALIYFVFCFSMSSTARRWSTAWRPAINASNFAGALTHGRRRH